MSVPSHELDNIKITTEGLYLGYLLHSPGRSATASELARITGQAQKRVRRAMRENQRAGYVRRLHSGAYTVKDIPEDVVLEALLMVAAVDDLAASL